ncbi:MAG: hypothetical protein KY454_13495 [Actinobacteria bacterium]|nr:hypothetical protein [Actinomycetota bacterium]MBW3615863.1 hypothetical protein [Actinomycetota bacterium]
MGDAQALEVIREIGFEQVHPLVGEEDHLIRRLPEEPAINIFFSNIMQLMPLRRWSSWFS